MSFERLVEKVRDNDVVLWVGAGFSLYAGMPGANTLRELIISNCTEEEKEFFKNQSLSDVANTFIDMRKGSRNELHKILQNVIDIDPKSIWAHQLVAEIPQIDLIVTTNYDKLFEEAYGRDISAIISDSHLPLATKRTQLYKIHGDISIPESIVLTSTDYTNFFRTQDKPLWTKIKTLLAEKTIIFLGYSFSDQNIDFLFDNVIKDIDGFQKEPYLVAPGIASHTLNRLNQKGITYIDMTGEDFIEKLHEEVKKKLLEDILNNKVDKEAGLTILEKNHDLNATIETTSKGSTLRSIGSFDKQKKFNLNVTFQDINFHQLLRNSQFNEFEISGDNIKAMNSHFEGISIPTSGEILSIKIIPLPSRKTKADIYFKGTDVILSDVSAEYFEGNGTELLRLNHPTIEFNFDEKKVNFTLKKIQRLRDIEATIQFLLTFVEGQELLTIYIIEDDKELDLAQMSPSENVDIRNELIEILQILALLKEIQQHYRIVFRDFELDFSEDTLENIEILKLHMNKESVKIDGVYFSTKDLKLNEEIMNRETFIENHVTNQHHFGFESTRKINSIRLFNQEFELNEDLIMKCNDAYISRFQKHSENLQEFLHFEVKSANEGIKMDFFSKDNH